MKLIPYFLLLLLFLVPIDSIYAEQPPEFWIKSMEGKRFRSSKQNSPYVISFFFVNCLPCIKEIPMLHQFMSTNYPSIPVLFMDPIKSDSKKDIKFRAYLFCSSIIEKIFFQVFSTLNH